MSETHWVDAAFDGLHEFPLDDVTHWTDEVTCLTCLSLLLEQHIGCRGCVSDRQLTSQIERLAALTPTETNRTPS